MLDAQGHLAFDCKDAQPFACLCKHYKLWCASPTALVIYLTTQTGFLCYFLFWLIQLPFLFVSAHKIRWLFLAKGVLTPIAWLAMIIWAFVKVPASQGLFSQHATVEGTYFSWAWLSAMNSALGIYASLSVNIPDFTVSPVRCTSTFHDFS
jgi:cytosine/uracil/thiamine/allantoin permease